MKSGHSNIHENKLYLLSRESDKRKKDQLISRLASFIKQKIIKYM